MFASIKSRLWLGYLLLSLVIIGSMVLGLIISLARSPILYRAKLQSLRTAESSLVQTIDRAGDGVDLVKTVQSVLEKPHTQTFPRVIILDATGNTLLDSFAATNKPIVWKSLKGITETEDLTSFEIIRDSRFIAWIYVGRQLANGDYLVVADLKGNPSLSLIFSNPVSRTIFWVIVISMVISLLLTLLLEKWVSRPIVQIAENAKRISNGTVTPLKIEGPKEVRDLALTLNEMNLKVSESQQAQRDFISDVSHELKTPLTSIQGFSQAIVDGTVVSPKDVKHAAEVIQSEAGRMFRLVTDLLMLAHLEGGADRLNLVAVDLTSLVKNILDHFEVTADTARVKLVDSLTALPLCVTDPDRVIQIVSNLLDNAIKFSPAGSSVEVSSDFNSQRINVIVTDHGIGIAVDEQKRIFDRFYQVDRSRSKAGYSSGLGLPIARQIARNLGGDLVVNSQPGKGSAFKLTLPMNADKAGNVEG